MMFDTQLHPLTAVGEKDLRRQINLSVTRALVDGSYADLLLSDPTVVLEDHGCSPQQYKALRGIHATTLLDFATQAAAIFWSVQPHLKPLPQEDQPLLAAAAH
jgi:hypothetical protein